MFVQRSFPPKLITLAGDARGRSPSVTLVSAVHFSALALLLPLLSQSVLVVKIPGCTKATIEWLNPASNHQRIRKVSLSTRKWQRVDFGIVCEIRRNKIISNRISCQNFVRNATVSFEPISPIREPLGPLYQKSFWSLELSESESESLHSSRKPHPSHDVCHGQILGGSKSLKDLCKTR